MIAIQKKTPTISQRASDFVVKIISSWYFVAFQIAFIATWIGLNQAKNIVWDLYPFDTLKLILMIESVIVASIVLMNQNRQAQFDRKIIYQDYIINCQIKKELHDIHPIVNEHQLKIKEVLSLLKKDNNAGS